MGTRSGFWHQHLSWRCDQLSSFSVCSPSRRSAPHSRSGGSRSYRPRRLWWEALLIHYQKPSDSRQACVWPTLSRVKRGVHTTLSSLCVRGREKGTKVRWLFHPEWQSPRFSLQDISVQSPCFFGGGRSGNGYLHVLGFCWQILLLFSSGKCQTWVADFIRIELLAAASPAWSGLNNRLFLAILSCPVLACQDPEEKCTTTTKTFRKQWRRSGRMRGFCFSHQNSISCSITCWCGHRQQRHNQSQGSFTPTSSSLIPPLLYHVIDRLAFYRGSL